MKVLITGGTGFVGGALVEKLRAAGHSCVIVSRKVKSDKRGEVICYTDKVPAVDAVINLAGELIAGLWTPGKKKRILESRIQTTRWCVDQIRAMSPRPKVFLSASAIGIYGHRPAQKLTEESPPDSQLDFLSRVCLAWERAAEEAGTLGVRTVLMRFGHVLHPSGGYLQPLMPLYRMGLCIGLGQPETRLSWVSRADILRAIDWFLQNEQAFGVFNITAPVPCTQREFSDALAQSAGKKKTLFFVPPVLLRMGMGEFSSALLRDQQVIPDRLQAQGFVFHDRTIKGFLN